MSVDSIPTNVDVAQLVQMLRANVSDGSEEPLIPRPSRGAPNAEAEPGRELADHLRSIHDELDALSLQIESGEPLPAAPTLRGHIGSVLKNRLYRFLWWQGSQIKALANISLRSGREETKLIAALSISIGQLSREVRRTHELVFECRQRVRTCENRLQQLESAQLRIDESGIEKNVRQRAEQAGNGFISKREG